MTNPRVARGRKSQDHLAEYLRRIGLFPAAEAIAASLPGADIKNTPEVYFEVKATEKQPTVEALKQAIKGARGTGDLPVVVYRPRGYGEARIDEWVASMTLQQLVRLLAEAGYGEDN